MQHIHETWQELFDQYDFDLDQIYDSNEIIYPKQDDLFKVFEMDVNDIKIVLLGQDPYHNPGQAHGLSFSVPEGVSIPPSLRNIYKELQIEFPERNYVFNSGNLKRWFEEEKIFLLNASLSVIKNKPSSHMSVWQEFTNDLIKFISEKNRKCIFLLLGNFAKSKQEYIKNKKNIVLGTHPSPLSASKGFFNSEIFKKVETKLGQKINWNN